MREAVVEEVRYKLEFPHLQIRTAHLVEEGCSPLIFASNTLATARSTAQNAMPAAEASYIVIIIII